MLRARFYTLAFMVFIAGSGTAMASEAMDVKADALRRPVVKYADTSTKTVTVQGTVSGGGRAFAIIDGRTYHAGDIVSGYRIVSIETGLVVFERKGVNRTVKVGP